MTLRVKTTDDFDRKNYRFKRVKTIDSQIYMNKTQTAEDNIRHRIKTMISRTDNYLEKQIELRTQSKISEVASQLKTPRRIDKYDEDNQNLTHDFATDWSRMDTIKRQTYSRLRSKFVKKFPSFREKYKKQDLDEEEVENKVSTKRSSSLNKTYRQSDYMETLPHQSKSISNAVIKVACFYSRSQKKCLYNSFTQEPIEQTEKEMPMPRMSFMAYIKNHKERDVLKIKRIKGQNLIKTRENILRLEKEGTKSFINLKKCLDQSIQTCIRGK